MCLHRSLHNHSPVLCTQRLDEVEVNRREGDPRMTRYISWLLWHYQQGRDVSKMNHEDYERRAKLRKKTAAEDKKRKAKEDAQWVK